ncbi:CubicO group peptidase (beta-lactamase class C family) [Arthrobacter silviterrae]|uniref:Beta-lactamase family protein n=1 Tax=Arthrobacter silviterrae TaxID=2026658 RepID=A0ABX0DHL3_9MICC|nr:MULTISPECIES: serine hydrolase domain-containing protein [Arthrobacter]MCU6480991.1 beta-lactamase family protein [Arthrobacter sp. A2-55]MDQ0278083.1 CubicO group peptidase (beta-lactamase class C family) [Arthrobacter silviterrae]NGN84925.1 beta-lactamase family protein [Arthrobacter silviterrae]
MTFATEQFAPVRELFESMLDADPAYSAQLAVYVGGTKVVDLAGGPDSTPDSLTGVFSVSKGVAALAFSLLVQDGLIDLDAAVAAYWPEFARHGKGAVTVRQLLSHQAGLVGVQGGFAMEDYNDLPAVAGRLADMAPLWRPGSGTFGYHALTMGVFLEELCRQVTGERLQDIYNRRIREPFAADMFLGLPDSEEARFRPVLFDDGSAGGFLDPGSLAGVSGNVQAGNLLALPNIRSVRAAGSCSGAGVGCADGLARVYAAATTGLDGLEPFLSPETIAAMSQEQVWGLDRIFCDTSAFAITFMKSQPRMDFGSAQAFGHDGANAALGYADPLYGIGFGYIPARAEEGGTAGRAMQLSAAVRKVMLAAG